MDAIRQGALRFRYFKYPSYRELFQQLDKGQKPKTLFITCSDSRIDPALITDCHPGSIFVGRNAGNFIPDYQEGGPSLVASEVATIEFAVQKLHVENIVICGHTGCGAMKGLLDPTYPLPPPVRQWVDQGTATLDGLKKDKKKWKSLKDDEKLAALTEANVKAQVDRVSAYASVTAGKLQVAGWVYDIKTGIVREYSPQTGKFEELSA